MSSSSSVHFPPAVLQFHATTDTTNNNPDGTCHTDRQIIYKKHESRANTVAPCLSDSVYWLQTEDEEHDREWFGSARRMVKTTAEVTASGDPV